MDDVEAVVREAHKVHGLDVVFLDYAQEVADLDPRTPRYLTVGSVAQRSVALARELDLAVVIASQVNVVKDGRGTSYVFRESQILEHKAHNVLLFIVEWQVDEETSERYVKEALLKATKCRGTAVFEHRVDYHPELYTLTDQPWEVR